MMARDGDATAADGRPAPLVSVIVATFNSRLTLACALDSVRRQSCQDFEVWVVGDACTDGSEAVVAAIGDPRFHWTNLARNSGSQAGPNNEGLRHARGRFVAYLGHDDLWFPWHLETLVDTASSEGASFVHGLGVLLGPGSVAASGPPRRGATYRGHCVPPTNWLVERSLLERIGPWREPLSIGGRCDLDAFDRIVATGARIACVPAPDDGQVPLAAVARLRADAPRPQIAMSQELARDAGHAGGAPPLRSGRRARPRHAARRCRPRRCCSGATRRSAPRPPGRDPAAVGGAPPILGAALPLAVPAPPPPRRRPPRPASPLSRARDDSGVVSEPLRDGQRTTPEWLAHHSGVVAQQTARINVLVQGARGPREGSNPPVATSTSPSFCPIAADTGRMREGVP